MNFSLSGLALKLLFSEIPTFGDKKTGGCTSSHDFGSWGGSENL